ncbi:MAG: hypothetical protein ACLQSW_04600, partial [Syntrophobacteraceae bacterium]
SPAQPRPRLLRRNCSSCRKRKSIASRFARVAWGFQAGILREKSVEKPTKPGMKIPYKISKIP